MELVLPGKYIREAGREVPVYWDKDKDVEIGVARLTTVGARLRANIRFFEMVLPPELMTSIQNNPNVWAVGTLKDQVQYMCARVPEPRKAPERQRRYLFGAKV